MFKQLVIALTLLLPSAALAAENIKIGSLPAADSIILYVAADEGIFLEKGLNVEIIPFQSALELGAAMRAKALQGHFGDIINVITQYSSGIPQSIIATTTYASAASPSVTSLTSPTSPSGAADNQPQRYFGLAVSPKSTAATLADLQGKDIAIGSSTIVDYLTSKMLKKEGFDDNWMNRQDIRQIPIRLQMLLSGQIESALLPEPLLSLVESKGARILADDRGLDEPLAVIALSKDLLDSPSGHTLVLSFREALSEAALRINADPEKYRSVMLAKRLLSPDAEKYEMIRFDMSKTPLGLPTTKAIALYAEWMQARGILKNAIAADIVWHE